MHREAFTRRSFCTGKPLHKATFKNLEIEKRRPVWKGWGWRSCRPWWWHCWGHLQCHMHEFVQDVHCAQVHSILICWHWIVHGVSLSCSWSNSCSHMARFGLFQSLVLWNSFGKKLQCVFPLSGSWHMPSATLWRFEECSGRGWATAELSGSIFSKLS